MYAAVTETSKNKSVYIIQSYRKENGRTSSRVYRKVGRLDALLEEYHGDKDKMMAGQYEAAKETQACRAVRKVPLFLSQSAHPQEEQRSFSNRISILANTFAQNTFGSLLPQN